MTQAKLAIIGGSGLYSMEGLTGARELDISTPYGSPSDKITVGSVGDTAVAFLPRHGRGHRISPTRLPVKANVYALKTLGVERIVSVSAVGSLQEEMRPLDMVVPDQIIDRTFQRDHTFFDEGLVAHVAFSDPFCASLSGLLHQAAVDEGVSVHRGGTYIAMEGPAFSTRAESNLYRLWGAHIIGMTAIPEAKLAREAEICYSILACVTDYDCWREATEGVTVEMVIANLQKNAATSINLLRSLISKMPGDRNCPCATALDTAIVTPFDLASEEFMRKLAPIIRRRVT